MSTPTEKFQTASMATAKKTSAGSAAVHPLPLVFLRNYAFALRGLLIDGYLGDISLSQIRLSLHVSPPKPNQPARIVLIPARVGSFDKPLFQISWPPYEFRHSCLNGIRSLFVDMQQIIQRDNLNIRLGDTMDGKIFVFDSTALLDMVQLLRAHKQIIGYKTLDDRADEKLTTRKADIPELAARFMRRAGVHAGTPVAYFDWMTDVPAPPRAYVSPAHAVVGMGQAVYRKTIPVSLDYLENLGRQATGQKIPENQGLLRLQ